ncbi:MAG: hypothetical protein LBI05_11745 [Planctomycetaceae bacterium]|jgi:uncharacterized protein HemY|nr:hypothetical protein [Planctomycetaceae bacterium]
MIKLDANILPQLRKLDRLLDRAGIQLQKGDAPAAWDTVDDAQNIVKELTLGLEQQEANQCSK